MDNNLKIPNDKRHKFTQPLGKLIAGKREDTLLEIEHYFKGFNKKSQHINFYLVGDIVTQDFLSNEFLKNYVKLCIIDEKTQREQIKLEFKLFFEQTIDFKSPAGSIPKESWDLLKRIVSSKKRTVLKIIEGEEDLLVLPLVMAIPLEKDTKCYVFYGQPPVTDSKRQIPEGIVMVEVNKAVQKIVKKYISMMDKL